MKPSTVRWLVAIEVSAHAIARVTSGIAYGLVWSQTSGWPRAVFTVFAVCWCIDKLLESYRHMKAPPKPRAVQVNIDVDNLDIAGGFVLDGEDEQAMRDIWQRAQAKRRAAKSGPAN